MGENSKNFIKCSDVNKYIFDKYGTEYFLQKYPEYDGEKITHNQRVTMILKLAFVDYEDLKNKAERELNLLK